MISSKNEYRGINNRTPRPLLCNIGKEKQFAPTLMNITIIENDTEMTWYIY